MNARGWKRAVGGRRGLFLPLLFFIILHSSLCPRAFGQRYSIDWYKISSGGGASANGRYSVSGTVGQPDAGASLGGGSYSLTGGFWSLISVVQTVGAPSLTVTHSGNNVVISWPSPSTGFVLQQNQNPAAGSWSPANGFTVSDNGTNKSITITSRTRNVFFRLKR